MGEPRGRLGAYTLTSRLGVGGMGETWRAARNDQNGVRKEVVIKCIRAEYANDAGFIEAFINEARLSALLSHGNVAQVFEFGQVEGQHFMAMEFVRGCSLATLLLRAERQGLLGVPVPLAVFVVMEVLKGLHHAHQRVGPDGAPLNMIHRDVTPGNVLISYEGEVKLTDFGVAKARLAERIETRPGVLKGKVQYMSPEQARGGACDARTDVWAAGIVLFEALAGRAPLVGPAQEVLPRIVAGDLPRLGDLAPHVSTEFALVLGKALQRDPKERWPSALAFEQALASQLRLVAPETSQLTVSGMMAWLFGEEASQAGSPPAVPPQVERMLLDHQRASMPATAVHREPKPTRPEVPEARGGVLARLPRASPVAAGGLLVAAALGLGVALSQSVTPERPITPPPPESLARLAPTPVAAVEPPPAAVEPAQDAGALVQSTTEEPARERKVRPELPESSLSREAAALLDRAQAAQKKGNLVAAERHARACVAADSKAYECCRILGDVLAAKLETAAAIEWYAKFLDHAPADHPKRVPVLRTVMKHKLQAVPRR
jgi:eukaryotic-like serine/threonine-protein kinase